jgi:hypothetical protein
MNGWLSGLLTAGRCTRRLALAAPVVLAAGCASSLPAPDSCRLSSLIKHFVAFRYKPNVTQQQKDDVMNRFLALKQECKRDGKNYIVSLVGGDCTQSLEGLTESFEQAYIVTFKDQDDYKYYIGQPFSSTFDPAHDAFKKYAMPLLSVDEKGQTDGAIALDFSTAVSPDNC